MFKLQKSNLLSLQGASHVEIYAWYCAIWSHHVCQPSVSGGKASDKFIFNDSGILNQLESGDSVMVDRGFHVDAECEARNVRVIRPAFI